MKESTSQYSPAGLHAAIIMDGNGRWAAARGWPRVAGHRAGAEAVRRTVEAAPGLGIGTLTLYAFSSDNWQRPTQEVRTLLRLFEDHLKKESSRCADNGIRLNVIGRRDRLSRPLVLAIDRAECVTAPGSKLLLRIAIDYSARDTILQAAGRLHPRAEVSRESFSQALGEVQHSVLPAPEVDLLIRTGGEQRLSDFLLWECAYAELLFLPRMWPDFDAGDLADAVREFHRRERRFGSLPLAAATPA